MLWNQNRNTMGQKGERRIALAHIRHSKTVRTYSGLYTDKQKPSTTTQAMFGVRLSSACRQESCFERYKYKIHPHVRLICWHSLWLIHTWDILYFEKIALNKHKAMMGYTCMPAVAHVKNLQQSTAWVCWWSHCSKTKKEIKHNLTLTAKPQSQTVMHVSDQNWPKTCTQTCCWNMLSYHVHSHSLCAQCVGCHSVAEQGHQHWHQ